MGSTKLLGLGLVWGRLAGMVQGFGHVTRWGVLGLVLLASPPAQADPFCDRVSEIAQALAGGAQAPLELRLSLPGPEVPEALCTVSQNLSGGKMAHCGWPFAYRAPEARQNFEALLEVVSTCMGAQVERSADQPVNHPDAYDLVELRGQGRVLGVSLKDKAGLQQTYVFLRIAPEVRD